MDDIYVAYVDRQK